MSAPWWALAAAGAFFWLAAGVAWALAARRRQGLGALAAEKLRRFESWDREREMVGESRALAACPFCGCRAEMRARQRLGDSGIATSWRAHCRGCGAQGPETGLWASAEAEWDRRVPIGPPAPPPDPPRPATVGWTEHRMRVGDRWVLAQQGTGLVVAEVWYRCGTYRAVCPVGRWEAEYVDLERAKLAAQEALGASGAL